MLIAPSMVAGSVPAVNCSLDLDVELTEEASGGEPGLTPENLAERRRRAALKAWGTRRARQAKEG